MPAQTRPSALAAVTLTATLLLACKPTANPGEEDSSGAGEGTTSTGDSTVEPTGADDSTSPTDPGTTGATGSTGEPPPGLKECVEDSDCTLVSNCCECDAKALDEQVAACEANCLVDTCTAQGMSGIDVACRSGRCEFAPVRCHDPVDCDSEPPDCGPGRAPAVEGGCWGPCVDAYLCTDLDCDSCPAGWACVGYEFEISHCEPLPTLCGDEITCSCLGQYIYEFCPTSCDHDIEGHAIFCHDGV